MLKKIMILFACISIAAVSNNSAIESTSTLSIDRLEEKKAVLTYKDIFKEYYKEVEQAYLENDAPCLITLIDFMDTYYNTDLQIQDYTQMLVEEVYKHTSNGLTEKATLALQAGNTTSINSSSSDAYYILKSADVNLENKTTNAFVQTHVYKNYNLFSITSISDVIVETKTWTQTGHAVIIESPERHCSSFGNYICTIEAVGSGVKYGFLDDNRMVDYKCVLLGVDGMTIASRYSAIHFARQQLNKPIRFTLQK